MPFWSTQTVRERLGGRGHEDILTPFDPKLVRQGAVQLRIGEQAAKSSDEESEIVTLKSGVVFCIPPGQFALLLTEEIVHLPAKVIAFISVKTRYKARGLVNVSGFHVDPGFHGRLKFWVYNAGNQEIVLQRYDPAFHIWFADMDEPVTDPFENDSDSMVISSDDIAKMQHGKLPTPAALRADYDELKVELRQNYVTLEKRTTWIISFLTATVLGLLIKYLVVDAPVAPRQAQQKTPTAQTQTPSLPTVVRPELIMPFKFSLKPDPAAPASESQNPKH